MATQLQIMPINKSGIRTSAKQFLREARELIMAEQVIFKQWVEELEITNERVWEIIERLTINNYCAGPEEDRDRSGTFLWKFGGTIEKQGTYIKLKIDVLQQGKILKCISLLETRLAELGAPARELQIA